MVLSNITCIARGVKFKLSFEIQGLSEIIVGEIVVKSHIDHGLSWLSLTTDCLIWFLDTHFARVSSRPTSTSLEKEHWSSTSPHSRLS